MNSKPHIFLDIDGVLALDNEMYWESEKHWYPKFNKYRFNPKAVNVFNEICEKTDPIVILSSDWKDHFGIPDMNEFFEWNGITHKISDFTPTLWGVRFTSFQQLEECRANEILLHVHEREIEKWVAIDDLDLKQWIPDNFVHTPRSNEGIKQSGVKDKILSIMLN